MDHLREEFERGTSDSSEVFCNALHKTKIVDAVQVTRCRNCIHYRKKDQYCEAHQCQHVNDYYCADGWDGKENDHG